MQSAPHTPTDLIPPGPPTIEHVAAIGRHARAHGNPAAITDPETIRAIRRRVEAHASGRGGWRRVLRRIRAGR